MAERKYKLPYEEYTDSTDVRADERLLDAAQQAGINQEKINWQKARDAGDKAGMDAAHRRAEEIRAQAGYSGGANGGAYNPFAGDDGQGVHTSGTHMTSPTWTPTYAKERADTVSQIKSRAPFSYDPEKDPTYQQYKAQYERGAQKAMQDTMGQVMARTGGLASSFAQTAGQQSYNATMAQLADKVPELRQLAYQMYMDEGDRLRSDLQMYDNLDSSDASRWQGTVLSPFLSDRAYAKEVDDTLYSRGQDALDRKWQQKLFDTERDDVAFERSWNEDERKYQRGWNEDERKYQRGWNEDERAYQRGQDAYDRQWNEDERDYQRGQTALDRERQARLDQEAKDQALADLLAGGGDYSGYGSLYGMTPEQQKALEKLAQESLEYNRTEQNLSLQGQQLGLDLTRKQIDNYGKSTGSGGSGSGGSRGGSGKSGGEETDDPLDSILHMSESEAKRTLIKMDLPQWKVNEYMGMWKKAQVTEGTVLSGKAVTWENELNEIEAKWGEKPNILADKVLDLVEKAQGQGLSDDQARRILARYGIGG